MVSPSVRIAAMASAASPPAFLTAAIWSLARLRSARMDSTSVRSRRRSSSSVRNSSSDEADAAPLRCRAFRTSSGFERTIFTSSIVTPRGRVGSSSWYRTGAGRAAAGGAGGRVSRSTARRAACYPRRTTTYVRRPRPGARSMPHRPTQHAVPRRAVALAVFLALLLVRRLRAAGAGVHVAHAGAQPRPLRRHARAAHRDAGRHAGGAHVRPGGHGVRAPCSRRRPVRPSPSRSGAPTSALRSPTPSGAYTLHVQARPQRRARRPPRRTAPRARPPASWSSRG